jgi:hypothetical protein
MPRDLEASMMPPSPRNVRQVSAEFGSLEFFVSKMEHQVQRIVAADTRRLEKNPIKRSYYAFHRQRLELLERQFLRRLHYGVIVVTYATIEETLVKLCDRVREVTQQQRFSVHDLPGYGLGRFRTYIDRTLGLDLTTRARWTEVQQIARLCLRSKSGGEVQPDCLLGRDRGRMRGPFGRGVTCVQDGGYRQLQDDGLLLYGPRAPCVRPDHHHQQLDHD